MPEWLAHRIEADRLALLAATRTAAEERHMTYAGYHRHPVTGRWTR